MNEGKSVSFQEDTEEGQFLLLCDYGTIVSSRSVIVASEDKKEYHLFQALEPFPPFEEYERGVEFDEGELISTHPTWEDAYLAQYKLKKQ